MSAKKPATITAAVLPSPAPVKRKKAPPKHAHAIKPAAAYVLPSHIAVPAAVAVKLRLAVVTARDGGESWASMEARTMVSAQHLLNIYHGRRYVTPPVAVRLAQAFGYELQLTIVTRKKKAA